MLHLTWEKNSFLLVESSIDKAGELYVQRSTRCGSTVHALHEVLFSWKLCDAKVHCTLSSEVTFSYTTKIEVPSGLEEIIPTLIALEAEKIFPLPLKEIVWDSEFITSSQNETIDVYYVGIKKDDLESFTDLLLEAGLKIEIITNEEGFEFSSPSLITGRLQQDQTKQWKALAALLIFSLLVCFLEISHKTEQIKIATAQALLLLHQEHEKNVASTETLALTNTLKKEGTFLVSLVEAHTAWPKLLEELHQTLPSRYIWITKLSPIVEESTQPKKKKTLVDSIPSIVGLAIEGLYLENSRQASVVDEWVHILKKSSLFAIKEKRDEEIITLRCTPDNSAYAYPYRLRLLLKRPLAVYTSE